ncbi:MAG: hypothetical protein NTY98_05115 [Verrucomicrobia bacterium]|nr:hypothetical protein [Verrucomicrobiota bacterium]
MLFALALAVLVFPTPVPALASTGLLIMKCEWQRSTDMQTHNTVNAFGSVEFRYDPIGDLIGTMMKEGFSHPFIASTGGKLIEGRAQYEVDGAPAEQRVEINRYTGAITNFIMTSKGIVVLQGKCTRISGPDFGTQPDAQ